MSDIAIKVSNLTKIYKLYDKPTLRLKEALSVTKKKYHKDFQALNDVSFEIEKGERVVSKTLWRPMVGVELMTQ